MLKTTVEVLIHSNGLLLKQLISNHIKQDCIVAFFFSLNIFLNDFTISGYSGRILLYPPSNKKTDM